MSLTYAPRRSSFYVPGIHVPRPVFAFDVDGTLGDYHDHFIRFAEAWLGKEISNLGPYDGSVSLAKWCGISKSTYRKVKLAYRQGGMKRSMPVEYGADELTRTLRKRGAEVVICTTRPYLHLSNIEPDTVHWLKRNRIQYDNIIMGEHKYRDLAAMYGKNRVVMVLDDLPEMLTQASELGLPTVLRRADHNADTEWIRTVEILPQAQRLGLQLLAEWEGRQ